MLLRKRVAWVAAVFCNVAFAGEGRICVGEVSLERFFWAGLDGGETEHNPGPREFQITIDDREPVTALHSGSVSIEKLDLAKKHKVVILKNGKPDATFRFTFDEHAANELCLFYEPFYSLWHLAQMKHASCKCAPVEAK